MEDLIFWLGYGYFSFYLAGSFIGLRDNNLQYAAFVGLTLGGLRELTGKNILDLL